MGVLLYNMIYGDIPFTDDNDIVNSKIDFNKYEKNSNNNNINSYDIVNLSQYSNSNNICVNNNNNNNNSNNSNISNAFSDVNDLIKKCLKQNQNERIQLEDILKHRWLTTDSK